MTERKNRENPTQGEGGAFYRIVTLCLMAVLVGFAVSLASIAFVDSFAWLNRALLISPRIRVQYESNPMLLVAATLLVPALGGVVVGAMFSWLSCERRSLGPADVVRAAQLNLPLPDFRSGIVSTLAAVLSLGSGASVGQYGPIVYLGAMVGRAAAYLRIRIQALPTIAIACGVAAAISTAFNAPIAGLVFAHEVILRHYSMQAFAPTTVASATGYVVANVMFDRPALFLVNFSGVGHSHEFILFALLGVISAGIAAIFMKMILQSAELAARTRLHATLRTGFAGLAVGVAALWLPDVLGIGTEALRFATIEGAFSSLELLVLVAAKIFLTALCIGFGFAGGVFSPALLIGILSGALFWTMIDSVQFVPHSGIAAYAICGMMAVASPVIGAPLTVILIVFELTRNYDLTIAAMVAVVFSNLVSYRIVGRSLFDLQLERQGIDLSTGRDKARLDAMRVSEHATGDYARAGPDEWVADVNARLDRGNWKEVYVLDVEERYLGKLRHEELTAFGNARISEVVVPPELEFNERTSMREALEALGSYAGDGVPVVLSNDRRLLGIVTKASVIRAYLGEVDSIRAEENAPG
ncbi:MAG: chloride channel protein [Rhodobacteraceae bacterium]|nr:chloride channel protein [Paracoccaceae bacterium]